METRTDIRYDLLKAELSLTQNQVDKYDQLSITTKTWAVTLWVALAGWAFQSKQGQIALIGALVPLIFWFFDGYNKTYRTDYKKRRNEVQHALQALSSGKDLPKDFRVPNLPVHDKKNAVRNMLLLHVGLPYLILIIISLLIYSKF
ncbi:MAG: hypothetical protein ABSC29_02240 [Minisyncoccia bacterium]|jgi:hypothetical protein